MGAAPLIRRPAPQPIVCAGAPQPAAAITARAPTPSLGCRPPLPARGARRAVGERGGWPSVTGTLPGLGRGRARWPPRCCRSGERWSLETRTDTSTGGDPTGASVVPAVSEQSAMQRLPKRRPLWPQAQPLCASAYGKLTDVHPGSPDTLSVPLAGSNPNGPSLDSISPHTTKRSALAAQEIATK